MKLIQHVGLVHNHEPNFSITCGLNNCKSSFTLYESFRRHVYRKHRKLVLPHDDMDATEYMDNDFEEMDCHNDLEQTNELHARIDEIHPLSRNELLTNFKENLFSFILKCREKKNHIPQTVQQEIVNDINFYFVILKRITNLLLRVIFKKMGSTF